MVLCVLRSKWCLFRAKYVRPIISGTLGRILEMLSRKQFFLNFVRILSLFEVDAYRNCIPGDRL